MLLRGPWPRLWMQLHSLERIEQLNLVERHMKNVHSKVASLCVLTLGGCLWIGLHTSHRRIPSESAWLIDTPLLRFLIRHLCCKKRKTYLCKGSTLAICRLCSGFGNCWCQGGAAACLSFSFWKGWSNDFFRLVFIICMLTIILSLNISCENRSTPAPIRN